MPEPTVEHLMYEVEERAVKLRNEEWMNLICVVELWMGGSCLPRDPESLRLTVKRLVRQLIEPGGSDA